MALPDRLLAKISPEPNSGCWLWTGAASSAGYGQIWHGGIVKYAHRVVYEFTRGPIPAGLELDHRCRVRCCVNPDHLEPVTHKENGRRSPLQGLSLQGIIDQNRRKTHCPTGHEYTADNTRMVNNHRRCRECGNTQSRKYYQERKERGVTNGSR